MTDVLVVLIVLFLIAFNVGVINRAVKENRVDITYLFNLVAIIVLLIVGGKIIFQ